MTVNLNGGKEEEKATCTLIIKGFPTSLRRSFHSWCALRGLTMKGAMELLIRKCVLSSSADLHNSKEQ